MALVPSIKMITTTPTITTTITTTTAAVGFQNTDKSSKNNQKDSGFNCGSGKSPINYFSHESCVLLKKTLMMMLMPIMTVPLLNPAQWLLSPLCLPFVELTDQPPNCFFGCFNAKILHFHLVDSTCPYFGLCCTSLNGLQDWPKRQWI